MSNLWLPLSHFTNLVGKLFEATNDCLKDGLEVSQVGCTYVTIWMNNGSNLYW